MKFKYQLSDMWISKVADMTEFANGGTQVSMRLKDGRVFTDVLISNSTYVIAIRGYMDLPFHLEDVVDIFQSEIDKAPIQRGGWNYWDDWKLPKNSE